MTPYQAGFTAGMFFVCTTVFLLVSYINWKFKRMEK